MYLLPHALASKSNSLKSLIHASRPDDDAKYLHERQDYRGMQIYAKSPRGLVLIIKAGLIGAQSLHKP